MLPGVGLTEMILIVVLALVLVGPKDLPLMMRKFGRMTGRVRQLAFEFRQSFDELGRQAELDELRKEVEDLKKQTGLDELKADIDNETAAMQSEMREAMKTPEVAGAATAVGAVGAAAAGTGEASAAEPVGSDAVISDTGEVIGDDVETATDGVEENSIGGEVAELTDAALSAEAADGAGQDGGASEPKPTVTKQDSVA